MAKKNAHGGNSHKTNRNNYQRNVYATRPAPASKRQIRNIVLAILVVLVVAVAVALFFVLSRSSDSSGGGSSAQSLTSAQSGDLLNSVQPIVISSEGVGVRNQDAQDVTLYFDYSCHACAQIDDLVFDLLIEDVEDGKYNLLLQPVSTVNMSYHPVATKAALLVAQYDPQNFLEFHGLLMAYFWEAYQANDGSVVRDSDKSLEAVIDMAEQVGISQEIIDLFDSTGAVDYLSTATNNWMSDTEAGTIEGRGDYNATPEVVANNVSIRFSGSSGSELHENLLESLRNAGLDV